MLGRGLQSLIPPNGSNNPQHGAPQEPQPPVQQPQPVHVEPVAPHIAPPQAAAPVSTTPFVAPAESMVPPQQPAAQPVVAPSSFPGVSVRPEIPKPERHTVPHAKTATAIFQIEVEKVKPNPDQPRRIFDPEGIKELAASIREFGLLQPIVVTKREIEVPTGADVEYILISGERRLLASKTLGLERIPAIIRNVDLERERLELAIIENIQRENLNPIEVARSFSRLQDEFRLTQREIASRLGKSREVVANAVRLLDLPPVIQDAVERGQISESHGRLLLTIDDPGAQERLFQDLVSQRMTTRELKYRVDAIKQKSAVEAQEEKQPEPVSPELRMLQDKLSSELGAPVAIHTSGETGKITITFYSQEELQSILHKLEGEKF